jgi:outer membrane protein assembly factor BamB
VRRSACLSILIASLTTVTLFADNWPQWRGPELNGVSRERGLTTTWTQTENVAWKLAMPSRSGATPIVWNDTIFLNVALHPSQGELELWSVDRNSGSVTWKRPL